jgi:hypothetical protein
MGTSTVVSKSVVVELTVTSELICMYTELLLAAKAEAAKNSNPAASRDIGKREGCNLPPGWQSRFTQRVRATLSGSAPESLTSSNRSEPPSVSIVCGAVLPVKDGASAATRPTAEIN